MALVYKHLRKDTNEIFYIGIGSDIDRITSRHHRNPLWLNIVNKVGYDYEIIEDNLSWEAACELEKKLIMEYGRRDNNTGILVNMTDGGEGTPGIVRIISEETKQKISNTLRGNTLSTETKKKISEALKGKIVSEETRMKLSKANKGQNQNRSDEEYEKWRKSMIGVKKSEEAIKNIKRGNVGKNVGRVRSEETKKKISDTLKNKVKKDLT